MFQVDTDNNRKIVKNFENSWAAPKQILTLICQANLLSNPNVNPKNEVASIKNVYASKLKLPVVFQKQKLKLCICVWTFVTWLRALESTLPFKIAYRSSWETVRLSKMLYDNTILIVPQSGRSIMLPKFPAALSFLNLLEPPSLFGEYLIFFLWF